MKEKQASAEMRYLVKGEDVVSVPAAAQVGVFDAAVRHRLLRRLKLLFAQHLSRNINHEVKQS